MPENLSKLQAEIRRADEKQAELTRNIVIMKRGKEQDEKRIQATKSDIERAEETLRKQQKDLERDMREQKENLEKMESAVSLAKEYERNQIDLKRKLDQLTREMAAVNKSSASQGQKRASGFFGR